MVWWSGTRLFDRTGEVTCISGDIFSYVRNRTAVVAWNTAMLDLVGFFDKDSMQVSLVAAESSWIAEDFQEC